jgi:hypothetical protein
VHPARPLAEGRLSCPICDEAFGSAVQKVLQMLREGE